ncbi:MAG: hypothetical protein CM1200mP12_17000 [Gammaproteobacteria bacterium]|nr:MAG: hypothetical protein CM1200mP12_17000 [Gammaproteobacteria bacterium]
MLPVVVPIILVTRIRFLIPFLKKDQTKVLKDLAVMQGLIKASGNSWSKDSEKIENLNDFLNQNSDQIDQILWLEN